MTKLTLSKAWHTTIELARRWFQETHDPTHVLTLHLTYDEVAELLAIHDMMAAPLSLRTQVEHMDSVPVELQWGKFIDAFKDEMPKEWLQYDVRAMLWAALNKSCRLVKPEPTIGVRATTDRHVEEHYGDDVYEPIKIIEHFGLGFNLGNTLKYLLRAGKKGGAERRDDDLFKAENYLHRERTTTWLPPRDASPVHPAAPSAFAP